MKKSKLFLVGIISGIINSLFGSGAGIVLTSFFASIGFTQKKAQGNSLLVMIFLSAVSAAFYLYKDFFTFSEVYPYLPFGFLGAFIGSFVLRKFPEKALNLLFSLFMIYSGLKILL